MQKSKKCNAQQTLLGASFAIAMSAIVFVSPATVSAAASYTNYVSDSLEVPVRRGAGYEYKISRMLKTGHPVKILEVNDNGWAKVEYQRKGKKSTGWMPSILLQNQPVAKDRLAAQIQKTSDIEEKYNGLQTELDTLKVRFDETDSALASIKQDKFELTKELKRLKNISSNAVLLDEENTQMKMRLSQLESQNAIMKEQIDQSDDSVKRQWFLTGGGVLLLGLLLGRFFRPPSRRKKWGEL